MIARRRLLVSLFTVVLGLLLSTPVSAAEWDRFPDPRSHVGIKKRFDGPKYTDLRRCLRGLDSRVDAEYFAGLVDVTDKEGSRSRKADDARPYADALFEEWDLDGSEDVLMVVGIRNRSLGVRPGEKWQKLGLDERTIDETVEASDYEKYRRRGDYGDALCSLATALDYRLAALEQSMKRRIERIGSRLPELEKEHAALAKRVDASFPEEHPYGDQLREKLGLASQFLSDAKETLEKEPTRAVNLADNATEAMDEVREKLQLYKSKVGDLDDIEAKIETLRRQIEDRDDAEREGPQQALSMLQECQSQVDATRQTLETNPASIRVCIAEVEARLARADVHHEYRSEVVPTVVTVALASVLVVLVILLFLRRRRTLSWLRPEMEEWRRELEDARQRLAGLASRFPEYFGDRDPWVGESASLDEQIRYHTTTAALLRERGHALLERAEKSASSIIPLAIFGPERAMRLLRNEPVSFEAGAQPDESPIRGTLPNPYSAESAKLLGDLYQNLVDSVSLLEQAASDLEEVFSMRELAAQLHQAGNEAVAARRELGLPMVDIQQTLDELADEHDRVRALARRDPLSAKAHLEELVEKLESTNADLGAANEAYRRVTGPLSEKGEALRNRIRELKRKGISIEEAGFNPADALDATARLAERVEELARSGRGEEALDKTQELAAQLEDLQQLIAVSEEAEDVIPDTLEGIKEQRDALKSDILKVRVAIGRAQEESGSKDGRMARISELQSSLSDRALHINRVQRALHKGEILTAAADTSRSVELLERGKKLTLTLADELGVERESLQSPDVEWPAIWRHSALASWHSTRFGSAGSSDLPW
jgi:septation ring formation regulator EzrA